MRQFIIFMVIWLTGTSLMIYFNLPCWAAVTLV